MMPGAAWNLFPVVSASLHIPPHAPPALQPPVRPHEITRLPAYMSPVQTRRLQQHVEHCCPDWCQNPLTQQVGHYSYIYLEFVIVFILIFFFNFLPSLFSSLSLSLPLCLHINPSTQSPAVKSPTFLLGLAGSGLKIC